MEMIFALFFAEIERIFRAANYTKRIIGTQRLKLLIKNLTSGWYPRRFLEALSVLKLEVIFSVAHGIPVDVL